MAVLHLKMSVLWKIPKHTTIKVNQNTVVRNSSSKELETIVRFKL